MGTPGRKRKRYVLFLCDPKATDEPFRTDVTRMFHQRLSPTGKPPLIVWLEGGFIVKADNRVSDSVRSEMAEFAVGGVRVTQRLTSGSISKLKRAAEGRSAGQAW